MERLNEARHSVINTEVTQGGQFAASFGFYQSIGFNIGLAKDEDEEGDRYIPIKKISAQDLHSEYLDTLMLNEKVNRHAATLSQMLIGNQPTVVQDALQYCFREIMRNTFEHANIDSLWVCGQYWPARKEAEIAVLDEGIGVFRSLHANSRISVSSCKEANKLALQPGLSRTLGMKQDPFDVWQNSGYGLYVASTLCAMNGGYFVLSSGDSAILVNSQNQIEYSGAQQGTAVCLNIRVNSKKLKQFDQTLSAIVNEGERKARENGEKRILTASKVTTIASMIRHIENEITDEAEKTWNDESIIPINTEVVFEARSCNARGEISGGFSYNGKEYRGLLLNVDSFNRKKFVEEKMKVRVVVRKLSNNIYKLLESHKYKKTLERFR